MTSDTATTRASAAISAALHGCAASSCGSQPQRASHGAGLGAEVRVAFPHQQADAGSQSLCRALLPLLVGITTSLTAPAEGRTLHGCSMLLHTVADNRQLLTAVRASLGQASPCKHKQRGCVSSCEGPEGGTRDSRP